jgi:hypothetical protein
MDKQPTGCARSDGSIRPRLDKLDLTELLPSGFAPERAFWANDVIKPEIDSFLYFGLNSKQTPQKFWEAYCYLFLVHSNKRDSWEHARELKYNDDDSREVVLQLTDEDLMARTFDTHYSLCEFPWRLDYFLERLQRERREILADNEDRVRAYIARLAAKNLEAEACTDESERVAPARHLNRDLLDILSAPLSGRELAECLYFDYSAMESPAPALIAAPAMPDVSYILPTAMIPSEGPVVHVA